jgi:prophage regulatory protein
MRWGWAFFHARSRPSTKRWTVRTKKLKSPPLVRLMTKAEVLAVANVSYPTIWQWQRDGKFPRSRVVGGQSMWRSDEVSAWLEGLPVRRLKGDITLKHFFLTRRKRRAVSNQRRPTMTECSETSSALLIVYETTQDNFSGEPWVPDGEALWGIAHRERGTTTWRRFALVKQSSAMTLTPDCPNQGASQSQDKRST